jgi:hypothetical protein
MLIKCKVRAVGSKTFHEITFTLLSHTPDFSKLTIESKLYGMTQVIEVEPSAESRANLKKLFTEN